MASPVLWPFQEKDSSLISLGSWAIADSWRRNSSKEELISWYPVAPLMYIGAIDVFISSIFGGYMNNGIVAISTLGELS